MQANPTAFKSLVIDLLSITVIIGFFYFAFLGCFPLFTPDEGRYGEAAREMALTGDFITPHVNGITFLDKPILYFWQSALAIKLFGVKEWSIRFFPALYGLLGIVITYLCGRRLFDRQTAFLSALILSSTPLYFGGAHYANLDLEVAVLISTTLLLLLTAHYEKNKRRLVLLFFAYTTSALAFLTKGLIGFAFPALIIGCWFFFLRRWQTITQLYLIPGLLLIALIILPWYIAVQVVNPEFFHYFFVTQQVSRFLSTGAFSNKTPFWFYAPIILLGFFPWTLFLIQAVKKHLTNILKNKEQHARELYLLLWALIIFIFFSIPRTKIVGYIFPVFPPLSLLVGKYLSDALRNQGKSFHYQKYFFILCLSFMLIYPLINVIIPPPFLPYFRMINVMLALALVASFFAKEYLSLIFICILSTLLILFTMKLGVGVFNPSSVKALVQRLKPDLEAKDEVINYFKFYQDLPVYLEKKIPIVADWQASDMAYRDNWRRELWLGKRFQKDTSWLLTEATFWKKWQSSQRVYVFLNRNYFNHFKKNTERFFMIDEDHDILILSNYPSVRLSRKHP